MDSRTILLAAAATFLAPTLSAGDLDITPSHCHLPAWQPDDLPPNARFGTAVALEGHLAAASTLHPPLVVTYEQVDGLWTEGQVIHSPVGEDDLFGTGLTLEGGRLTVGASRDDLLTEDAGAVHIYERVDGIWTLVQTLRDDTPTVDGRFGARIVADGEWLGIAAPQDDPSGSIHMFALVDGVYQRIDTLTNGLVNVVGYDFTLRARPGEATADVFVGDFASSIIQTWGGAVWPYIVELDATIQYGPLVSADLQVDDFYGSDIAFDGAQLFVGASSVDDVAEDAGAVYVYDVHLGGAIPTFTQVQKILPADGAAGDRFGRGVRVDGGQLAVVGRGMHDQPETAYVDMYRPEIFGNGWVRDDRLMAEDYEMNDVFASDLEMDAGRLLVGANNKHSSGHRVGGVYLFSTLAKTELSGFSPSPYLAQHETYGEGKPGQAGVPVLGAASAAVPGNILVVGLTNVPVGATPVLFWGPTPAALPFDGGALLVADPIVSVLPVVGQLGQVGIGGTVPDDLALCGVGIHMQAMFVDEGADGPHQTAQSNGLKLTVGY